MTDDQFAQIAGMVERRLDHVGMCLERLETEVRDLRRTARQLSEASTPVSEYADVLRRLARLEDYLGIAHE